MKRVAQTSFLRGLRFLCVWSRKAADLGKQVRATLLDHTPEESKDQNDVPQLQEQVRKVG
jgi:hypothetical protein